MRVPDTAVPPRIVDALDLADELGEVGRIVRTAARAMTGAMGATFVQAATAQQEVFSCMYFKVGL